MVKSKCLLGTPHTLQSSTFIQLSIHSITLWVIICENSSIGWALCHPKLLKITQPGHSDFGLRALDFAILSNWDILFIPYFSVYKH